MRSMHRVMQTYALAVVAGASVAWHAVDHNAYNAAAASCLIGTKRFDSFRPVRRAAQGPPRGVQKGRAS